MIKPSIVILLVLTVGACAGPKAREGEGALVKANLQSSSRMPADTASYDVGTGQCSAGSMQLMSREEYESLASGWRTPANCEDVEKSRVPASTGYPEVFAKLGKSGSAQVLVRLEGDGAVESARAVCATDSAFAQAAEETAKSIRYRPSTCDGAPARSAFLLPFSYDF